MRSEKSEPCPCCTQPTDWYARIARYDLNGKLADEIVYRECKRCHHIWRVFDWSADESG